MTSEALATLRTYLLSKTSVTNLVGTRIAPKQLFGELWSIDSNGLVVTYASGGGGKFQKEVDVIDQQIALRGYSKNIDTAIRIVETAMKELKQVDRNAITLSDATQRFIYYFVPVSGVSLGFDFDVNIDFANQFGLLMMYDQAI